MYEDLYGIFLDMVKKSLPKYALPVILPTIEGTKISFLLKNLIFY